MVAAAGRKLMIVAVAAGFNALGRQVSHCRRTVWQISLPSAEMPAQGSVYLGGHFLNAELGAG
jgi:hypothetical protein